MNEQRNFENVQIKGVSCLIQRFYNDPLYCKRGAGIVAISKLKRAILESDFISLHQGSYSPFPISLFKTQNVTKRTRRCCRTLFKVTCVILSHHRFRFF